MPQPPSQPAQFSTPNPHKFRLPKRVDGRKIEDIAATPVGAPPATARPTPRFAPSWRRQTHGPQSQSPAQSQPSPLSGHVTPRGVPTRLFTSVSRTRQQSPFQHHHHHAAPPVWRTEDAIEDGSSPPRAEDGDNDEDGDVPETEAADGTPSLEDALEVVGESPTAVRAALPEHAQRLSRRRRRRGPQEEIEDVPTSGGDDDNDDNEVDENTSPKQLDRAASTTPGLSEEQPPPPRSVLPQQRSAPRLLSSVQPFKRRRLFVSPGQITSSPGDDEEEQEDGASGGGGGGGSGNDNDEPDGGGAASKSRQRSRGRPWDIEIDDDDDESETAEDEEIQDIITYGELLEYGESEDDEDGPGEAAANRQEAHDAEESEEDDYSILDRTPTRIRRARREQQQQQQQGKADKNPGQPGFPRARLFLSARQRVKHADENDHDADDHDDHDDHDTMHVDATPSGRTRSYAYIQPPPDFFSPRKKKKKSRKKKSGGDNDGDAGTTREAAAEEEGAAAQSEIASASARPQYVPGGLAAELRDWLVQIKSGSSSSRGSGMGCSADVLGCYQVAATAAAAATANTMTQSCGMRLVVGRQRRPCGSTAAARLLLAGDSQQQLLPMQMPVSITVAAPAWQAVVDGQAWVVASNWREELPTTEPP